MRLELIDSDEARRTVILQLIREAYGSESRFQRRPGCSFDSAVWEDVPGAPTGLVLAHINDLTSPETGLHPLFQEADTTLGWGAVLYSGQGIRESKEGGAAFLSQNVERWAFGVTNRDRFLVLPTAVIAGRGRLSGLNLAEGLKGLLASRSVREWFQAVLANTPEYLAALAILCQGYLASHKEGRGYLGGWEPWMAELIRGDAADETATTDYWMCIGEDVSTIERLMKKEAGADDLPEDVVKLIRALPLRKDGPGSLLDVGVVGPGFTALSGILSKPRWADV